MVYGFGMMPGDVDEFGRVSPFAQQRQTPVVSPFSFMGGAPALGDQPAGSLPPGMGGLLSFGQLPMPQGEPQAPGGLFPRPQASGGPLMGFGPGSPAAAMPLPSRAAPNHDASVPRIRPFGSLPVRPVDDDAAPEGGVSNPPLPPPRPTEFGGSGSWTAPEMAPHAIAAQGQAPGGEGLGMFDRFRSAIAPYSDDLMGLAQGLLTKRGIGPAIAAGLQYADERKTASAARDLASAKAATEFQKYQQGQAGIAASAGIVKKAYPWMSDAQATAQAANNANVTEALKVLRDPTHGTGAPVGYRPRADGQGFEIIPGGPQDPATIKLQAAARETDKTQTPLTDPTARLQAGLRPEDKRAAWLDASGKVTFEPGQPNTQVTVNTATSPILKGLGDQFVDSSDKARSAAEQVRAIHNARAQLDAPGGIVSGFRAGDRLSLQKVGALLGVADPGTIQNTEALRAALKPMVLEAVKGLGSNPSNGDRTFAEDFSGGNIALDEGSIRRILDLNERSARAKIDRHNTLSDSLLSAQPDLGAVKPLMRVEAPGAYSPQQARGSAKERFRQLQSSGLSRQEIYSRLEQEGY